MIRSDSPDGLTEAGWRALVAYGVRTIIDLRNGDERRPDDNARPGELTTLQLPLDGIEDREFWDVWEPRPPPLYYEPFLERFPERAAAVLAAIASARPGGVLVHCVGGRDRTGMIAMLVLALAGVPAERIADDHALSAKRMAGVHARLGIAEEDVDELLAREQRSARELVGATAERSSVERALRGGGLDESHFDAIRRRLMT